MRYAGPHGRTTGELPSGCSIVMVPVAVIFTVQWFAPLGIFRFSYGFPLNEFKGDAVRYPDEVERFQFTIGSAF